MFSACGKLNQSFSCSTLALSIPLALSLSLSLTQIYIYIYIGKDEKADHLQIFNEQDSWPKGTPESVLFHCSHNFFNVSKKNCHCSVNKLP